MVDLIVRIGVSILVNLSISLFLMLLYFINDDV